MDDSELKHDLFLTIATPDHEANQVIGCLKVAIRIHIVWSII